MARVFEKRLFKVISTKVFVLVQFLPNCVEINFYIYFGDWQYMLSFEFGWHHTYHWDTTTLFQNSEFTIESTLITIEIVLVVSTRFNPSPSFMNTSFFKSIWIFCFSLAWYEKKKWMRELIVRNGCGLSHEAFEQ